MSSEKLVVLRLNVKIRDCDEKVFQHIDALLLWHLHRARADKTLPN